MKRMNTDPLLNPELTVKVNMEVAWPNGEKHNMAVEIPLSVLLVDGAVMSEEWLRMLEVFSHDAGILGPNQNLQLISRDEEENE